MTHPQLPEDRELTIHYGTRTGVTRTPPYEPYQICRVLGCEYHIVSSRAEDVIAAVQRIDRALIAFCTDEEVPALLIRDVPRQDGMLFRAEVIASACARKPPHFRPLRLLRLINAVEVST